MKLKTEIIEEKQKALIISKTSLRFIRELKDQLKKNSVTAFFSPHPPKDLSIFDYCFFINEPKLLHTLKPHLKKKYVFIFLKNNKTQHVSQSKSVKIVNCEGENLSPGDLDKILWFAFSETEEGSLNLISFYNKKPKKTIKNKNFIWEKINRYLTPRFFIFSAFSIILTIYLSFIPPLSLSSYYSYISYRELKNNNIDKTRQTLSSAGNYLKIAKKLYSFSRPVFLLFSIALYPDNIIDINEKGQDTIVRLTNTMANIRSAQTLLLAQNKSIEEKDALRLHLKEIDVNIAQIYENINLINQKIPGNLTPLKEIKKKLITINDLLVRSNKIIKYLNGVILSEQEKKYLILFANNRELRPGGGFLGSFGIMRIGNHSISKVEVMDVYDADGQLTAHIEPPLAIKKYLGVPHWFLRDSNFSPDFLENYEKALFFLDKEIDLKGFEGGILITTSAVENILNSFGNVYVPDYKENVNSQNFYLITQQNVEDDFFPGSIQKKSFLSSLINQLYINLDRVSPAILVENLKNSLDEKQIIIHLENTNIQALIDSSFWSGRVIEPKCSVPNKDCVLDYIFPYDANVGANKANFFINRYSSLKTIIDPSGKISHLLSIQYINNSPAEIFPTGYYRNYFQLLLPKNSQISQVTRDGIKIDEIEENEDKYKLIGFYFEVPPKKTVEIKIAYELFDNIKNGSQIYQLVTQKQIGASNSDLILQFDINKNIYVNHLNFSPVVKDQEIIYNTNLSTDKLFLIELIKDKNE